MQDQLHGQKEKKISFTMVHMSYMYWLYVCVYIYIYLYVCVIILDSCHGLVLPGIKAWNKEDNIMGSAQVPSGRGVGKFGGIRVQFTNIALTF